MNPSLLVPDRTVAVAADGSVAVDFDLPRFGVSLVTITPAALVSDGGTDADGAVGAEGATGGVGQRGCGCRMGGRGDAATKSAALLGMIALILVGRRRRSIR
jgi:MYXO-CTERM domain-containing protein